MAAAVTWLVIWFVLGAIGSWLFAAGTFFSFGYGLAEEKWTGLGIGVLFGAAGIAWTVLWVIQFILQIISVVNILTGAAA